MHVVDVQQQFIVSCGVIFCLGWLAGCVGGCGGGTQ